ncbi:cerebellin-1-like [Alosa pseudoharengus]|uniref:cerebellin-1-like n=1 Tax=Alosa pseudoharengus TaxID=34774 RepID=UPI003F88A391
MVVELRVLLTVSMNDLEKMEAENDAQRTELVLLKSRLAATETEVEHVKEDTAAQEARLSASETEVEDMKMEVKNLTMANAAQETRLSTSETEVENLKMETAITEQPKVAFSAGLGSGYIVSGNTELNLVFTKIITNVGQAYSSTTGFFTAPVRGVYYFRFTVRDSLDSHYMTIMMYKNGERIIYLAEYDEDRYETYLSSGVTLQLEVGDVVNMRLPAGYRLYDYYSDNYSTFSGFLLFPL